eukprot:jgi/Psemu1/10435/gm1.10435_g
MVGAGKQRKLRDFAIQFDNIARKSNACDVYNWGMKCMKKHHHVQSFYAGKGRKAYVNPFFAASEDLTNAMHLDLDDCSRSYSLFFPDDKLAPGTTYFMLPKIGVYIELTGNYPELGKLPKRVHFNLPFRLPLPASMPGPPPASRLARLDKPTTTNTRHPLAPIPRPRFEPQAPSLTRPRSEPQVPPPPPTGSSPRPKPLVPSSPWPRSAHRVPSPPLPGSAPIVTPLPPSSPPDRLDMHVARATWLYHHSASWGDFIRTIRGHGDVHHDVATLPHPAGGLLAQYAQDGTPASMSGRPWNRARIAAALQGGPHQSSHQGIDFLREEFAGMMDKQQWTVLPARLIQHLPGLQLSPLGLVPQRDRRPRMISDYTFSQVNHNTIPLAPADSMQFGWTLPHLLSRLHRANN